MKEARIIGYLQYNFIYMTFCKRQNTRTEQRPVGVKGVSDRRIWLQMGEKKLSEMTDLSLSWCLWLHNSIHWSRFMEPYTVELCWIDGWKRGRGKGRKDVQLQTSEDLMPPNLLPRNRNQWINSSPAVHTASQKMVPEEQVVTLNSENWPAQ